METAVELRTDAPIIRLAPFALGAAFIAYFGGTATLYFWGPWEYPMPLGSGRLILFLIAVHVAFAVGYLRGIRGRPHQALVGVSIEKIVLAAAVAELLLLVPTSHFNTGQWFPNPWAAAEDLAAAYTSSIARRETGTPYANYVRMMLTPLLVLAVPLGVFYWRKLTRMTRALFTASVIGSIALYVSMGANAGAAHWMAMFPWFVLAGHLSGVQRLDRRGWIWALAVQLLSACLFVVLFSATMVQRTGSFAKYGYLPGIGAEVDHPRRTPVRDKGRSNAKIGADGLAGYLTQGYFAVYVSLHEPFVPCYGVGNSVFLQRQLARLTRSDLFLECSYPVRIQEKGWQASVYWATIYPWLASDVTFPGTVVVVFFVGWLAGGVWLDVLGGRNPIAVGLLGQVLVLLYYVPAHNKLMHNGEGVFGFSVLLFAWVWTRRHKVGRRQRAALMMGAEI
jgi:hypothetical protein